MLQTILSLYLQGIIFSAVLVVSLSVCWFLFRVVRRLDKTIEDRQALLFDLLMINVMTIPILAFGVVGILLIIKVW